jgi:hypothetical protein
MRWRQPVHRELAISVGQVVIGCGSRCGSEGRQDLRVGGHVERHRETADLIGRIEPLVVIGVRLCVVPGRQRVIRVRLGRALARLIRERQRVLQRRASRNIDFSTLGGDLVLGVVRVARLQDAVDPAIGAVEHDGLRALWRAVRALRVVDECGGRRLRRGCRLHAEACDQRHARKEPEPATPLRPRHCVEFHDRSPRLFIRVGWVHR